MFKRVVSEFFDHFLLTENYFEHTPSQNLCFPTNHMNVLA